MMIQENVPLAPLTTFKVGGPARFYVEATTEREVIQAVEHARSRELPLFVLGGGSNLVVSDHGFQGLVLRIAVGGVVERETNGKREFEAGGGEEWDALVALSVARNCAGIETLSGIPGTVGGTPVQNVGAYGQEVAETITSVRVLDLTTMQVRDLANEACGFRYRTSIFNSDERGRYIVLRVTFALTPNGTANVVYADLKKHFAAHSGVPSLAQVREAVRQIRLSKAMLIVPNDDDCRSAGSFFKNPVVAEAKYDSVLAVAQRRGLDREPPRYPAGNGFVKLSAAWLVENSGFHKGFTLGAAGISKRHALAIVNRGGATAADIIALKDTVQAGVRSAFDIELQPEPVMVGFDA
jgi:UDP-N-acetylmuramate dehydrogenase